MSLILFLLSIILVLYLIISWNEVRDSQDKFEFTYHWSGWIGAFVWEDILVYSFLHLLFLLTTFLFHDLRIGLMMISIFWIVRSAGETLYFFLQQFHEPEGDPHGLEIHFKKMEPVLGKISMQKSYILMQIFHQSVVVLAISAFMLLMINWENIPTWF